MTIAWVFPGQGSQKLGMADSLLSLPGAKERFDFASQLLDRDLLEICAGVNHEKTFYDLNDTRNTQPALFVVESLLVDDLIRQGKKASLVAGHSLGEIVALYASGVFDANTALSLLKRRSELMAEAGGGAMTALIGFERDQLEDLVKNTEDVVIANDNSSGQVVISGSPKAVNAVSDTLPCKRSIPLQVSGAFHSPYMEEASNAFAVDLERAPFVDAQIPVLSNSDPTPTCDARILKERLKHQMTNGVRWRETMEIMLHEGISTLVEIGPGNVLSGLAKRSMKGVSLSQISKPNEFLN